MYSKINKGDKNKVKYTNMQITARACQHQT
jgi:hypothetical protein